MFDMDDKIIGYKILPIKASDGAGMAMTACINSCFVTGKIIASSGGGMATSISPEVMEVLKNDEEVQAFIRERISLLSSNPVG